ncbi:hypothetical protein FOA43_000708 [Brettanomyces nanus]|uniref:Uncharacterized protein n=1 Tax=Eeniella nana TaxID=13502 RepID=A0A875RXM1_EENNA|nr:uncharacterized protein FOA43_000708 [Brettanomyces nanus]QPG73398.1 hypothetical protein FOA43_000708 [Brettanomyces nanus]
MSNIVREGSSFYPFKIDDEHQFVVDTVIFAGHLVIVRRFLVEIFSLPKLKLCRSYKFHHPIEGCHIAIKVALYIKFSIKDIIILQDLNIYNTHCSVEDICVKSKLRSGLNDSLDASVYDGNIFVKTFTLSKDMDWRANCQLFPEQHYCFLDTCIIGHYMGYLDQILTNRFRIVKFGDNHQVISNISINITDPLVSSFIWLEKQTYALAGSCIWLVDGKLENITKIVIPSKGRILSMAKIVKNFRKLNNLIVVSTSDNKIHMLSEMRDPKIFETKVLFTKMFPLKKDETRFSFIGFSPLMSFVVSIKENSSPLQIPLENTQNSTRVAQSSSDSKLKVHFQSRKLVTSFNIEPDRRNDVLHLAMPSENIFLAESQLKSYVGLTSRCKLLLFSMASNQPIIEHFLQDLTVATLIRIPHCCKNNYALNVGIITVQQRRLSSTAIANLFVVGRGPTLALCDSVTLDDKCLRVSDNENCIISGDTTKFSLSVTHEVKLNVKSETYEGSINGKFHIVESRSDGNVVVEVSGERYTFLVQTTEKEVVTNTTRYVSDDHKSQTNCWTWMLVTNFGRRFFYRTSM